MKKSMFAAVAATALGGSGAAWADTTLYGSVRLSIDYERMDFNEPDSTASVNAWDVLDNASRLGVKGSEDLGGGLSAVYQYEFGVATAEGGNFRSNRPKYVGLKGPFGSITAGTQYTPYRDVTDVVDVFNSDRTFEDSWLGPFGAKRLDNSLLYQTPDFNGFSGELMLVMNGQGDERGNRVPNTTNGVDLWNAAILFRNRPFFAGVTYVALEGDKTPDAGMQAGDLDQWALSLGYDDGVFAAGVIHEDGELGLGDLIDQDRVELADTDARNDYGFASYTFGDNKIRAAYGRINPDAATVAGRSIDGWDNYAAGFEHKLSKRSRLWLEYIGRRDDNHPAAIGDSDVMSIGMRHDF